MKIQSIIYKFLPVYSILLLIAFQKPAQAQESASLQRADSLFTEQKYTQAYQQYKEILETGKASPGMLLRMGYVQESLGNVSQVLYLLNLYYKQTGDREVLPKIEELAESRDLQGYAYSDNEYFISMAREYRTEILAGLMLLAGILFLTILYKKFRMGHKPVWSGIFLVLLLGALFYVTNTSIETQKAIVMRNYVQLMSGPSAGANVIEVIGQGHRLNVLGKEDVWYKVEWNEQILYIKETALARV